MNITDRVVKYAPFFFILLAISILIYAETRCWSPTIEWNMGSLYGERIAPRLL